MRPPPSNRPQVRYPANYRANFLWPAESGSIEEAGYEFANGKTEAYRKSWWKILNARIKKAAQAGGSNTDYPTPCRITKPTTE